MKVNIVCRNHDADRVLPRFSRYLADRNGWKLGRVVDTSCDVNYYLAYFEYLKNREYDGPLASYFTHVEPNKKGEVYQTVAAKSDLRVAMNPRQLKALKDFGPSVTATLPVELHHFQMRQDSTKIAGRPVIGFSGYVYRSKRKGEELARALVTKLGSRATFKASGNGWPCSTVKYKWADLPAFFRSLDLFVSTSLIEGGPMTTLEALASGIPVVIPDQVGIHPQLPYIPGIYRYVTGNQVSLEVAVDQALEDLDRVDREELRKAVSRYTISAYCSETKLAFEETFKGKRTSKGEPVYVPPPPPKPWPDHSGIYLVAFGAPARKCANTCIRAVKKLMPGLPVALCSTDQLNVGEDVFIKRKDLDIGGRQMKLAAYENAPQEWEYVLYLDADTEPVESLDFIFKTLETGWDVVICKDMARYAVARFMQRGDNREEVKETFREIGTDEVMQYNGGVFAFRRSLRVEKFFQRWQIEWQRWAGRDQGALLRALYAEPLKVFLLGNQWNASDRYEAPVGDIAVWHHNIAARRWVGRIPGRLDSQEAWNQVSAWRTAHGDASPKDIL